jgi:cell fate regulator YaaT (PSP1 superfamily)
MEEGDLKPIYRLANEEDEASVAENEELAREARSYCRGCIEKRKLDMKLVDVEVFFDRSKMVFYFTAQGRVDFRELVKDLVRKYRTRIELRQIGVRHETQMLGAVGNCGQVCCCRRFMRRFVPVTIKMAKEQNLFLNPTKISGICGRLLCCLSFEQANYESFHRSCPRLGKKYATTEGRAKPIRSNFFRQSLTVIFESGEEREIPLEEWSEMTSPEALEQAGEQPAAEAAGEPRKERRAKPPRKPSERKPPDKKSRGGGSRKKETEAPEPQAEQPADGQETSGESPAPEQAPAESSAPPAEGDKPKKGRSKKNYRPKRKRKSRSRSAKGPKKDGGQN